MESFITAEVDTRIFNGDVKLDTDSDKGFWFGMYANSILHLPPHLRRTALEQSLPSSYYLTPQMIAVSAGTGWLATSLKIQGTNTGISIKHDSELGTESQAPDIHLDLEGNFFEWKPPVCEIDAGLIEGLDSFKTFLAKAEHKGLRGLALLCVLKTLHPGLIRLRFMAETGEIEMSRDGGSA